MKSADDIAKEFDFLECIVLGLDKEGKTHICTTIGLDRIETVLHSVINDFKYYKLKNFH